MRKPLWLAPALLLAGCRSEQLVFQAQSATSAPVEVATTSVLTDTTLTATVAAPRPLGSSAAATAPLAAPASRPQVSQPVAPLHHHKAKIQLPALSKLLITKPLTKQLAHRLRSRSTEGAAESGLGGIGLFVIGVVLALLAGLGALVNLIFSVGFFTGVGYAAAGLVVLFLLYSLFSGGKGKKAK